MTLPGTLQAAALCTALGLAAGFAGGWTVQGWRADAAAADRLRADAEAQRLQARASDAAAARHEADKASIAAQRRVITQEVERVVEKPLYRDVCLDDDGLRLVAAAAGAASAASQPAPALPVAAPAR